jgi:hypothetical protein
VLLVPVAYLAYAAVKLAGYSLAAAGLKKLFQRPDASAWRVGLLRTALGIAVGGVYTLVWAAGENFGWFRGLPMAGGRAGSILYYLLCLVPVRFLEWGWLIWFCFDRRLEQHGRDIAGVIGGTLWSFALDLPPLMGALWFVASIC